MSGPCRGRVVGLREEGGCRRHHCDSSSEHAVLADASHAFSIDRWCCVLWKRVVGDAGEEGGGGDDYDTRVTAICRDCRVRLQIVRITRRVFGSMSEK